ncbi:MAG: c-type cytochrome biogenesis protein CcmI [Pseudomonadota bacterium]
MVTFWLLAIILFALSIAFILYPLLKKNVAQSDVNFTIDQKQINVDIAKDQLSILEADFAANEISQEEYNSLKYELESSLIDDISPSNSEQVQAVPLDTSSANQKILIALVIIFIPLCSVLFYQKLGMPGFIDGSALQAANNTQHSKSANNPSVEEMIGMLISKLKENPNDQKGWFLLARTYMALEKFDEAYKVYEKLLSLTGDDPAILVSMADALAMTTGGKISGEPEKLILRALKIAPDNITGLWLIGIAEKEKGNNPAALKYWNRLYPLVKDEEAKQSVAKMIKSVGGSVSNTDSEHNHDNSLSQATMDNLAEQIQAAKQAPPSNNTTANKTMAKEAIQVSISLSDEMKEKVSDNDIVFVYAKALQGPPMPLAAYKKKVSELPITVILDDSMAMMPTMKISSFKQVKVGARISKSGQPMKQAGDLMSAEITVDLSNIQAVKLTINSVVK